MAQTKVVKGKKYVMTANGWRYDGEASNNTIKTMGKGDPSSIQTNGLREKMQKALADARNKNKAGGIKLPGR